MIVGFVCVAALVFALSIFCPGLFKPIFIVLGCGLMACLVAIVVLMVRFLNPIPLPDFDLKNSSLLLPVLEKGAVTDGVFPPKYSLDTTFKRLDQATAIKVEQVLGEKDLVCVRGEKSGETVYFIGHLSPNEFAPYLVHGRNDSQNLRGRMMWRLANGWEEWRIVPK